MVVDHPFLVGFGVSFLLIGALSFLPIGALPPGRTRALGLIIYSLVLMMLFRRGLDKDDVFWFFLGSLVGTLAGMFATL
jgi:hypothetical protein